MKVKLPHYERKDGMLASLLQFDTQPLLKYIFGSIDERLSNFLSVSGH